MKKLEMNQLEILKGGKIDCAPGNVAAFVGGATVAGAIFFGWGAIVTGYAALAYATVACDDYYSN